MKNMKQDKKVKRHNRNNMVHMLSQPIYADANGGKVIVDLIQFENTNYNKTTLSSDFNIAELIKDNTMSWFKITGLSDKKLIENIYKQCEIESFDLRNLYSDQYITRFVEYTNTNYISMSTFFVDNDAELCTQRLIFIQGKNFVISIQDGALPFFDKIENMFEKSKWQLHKEGADFFLCMLFNSIYTAMSDSIFKLINHLNDVEDLLINEQISTGIISQTREGKYNYMAMRRIIFPIREEYQNLLHNMNGLISKKNMLYFNDFDDKLRSVISDLEIYSDTIRSVLEIYYNNNNKKMNDIMTRLTIVSTIFIPLTFMVGVWGMNFKYMPEIELKYGYLYAWIVLVAITVIAIWWLKKKKWF